MNPAATPSWRRPTRRVATEQIVEEKLVSVLWIQTRWATWGACHGRSRGSRDFVNLLGGPRPRLAPEKVRQCLQGFRLRSTLRSAGRMWRGDRRRQGSWRGRGSRATGVWWHGRAPCQSTDSHTWPVRQSSRCAPSAPVVSARRCRTRMALPSVIATPFLPSWMSASSAGAVI